MAGDSQRAGSSEAGMSVDRGGAGSSSSGAAGRFDRHFEELVHNFGVDAASGSQRVQHPRPANCGFRTLPPQPHTHSATRAPRGRTRSS